jgi:tetratricopeptide (TPR) repeat protein
MEDGFDFDIFEKLVNSRLSHLEGKQTESKVALEESQIKIEQQFSDFPVGLAADSLKIMLDLGDFEEAAKVCKALDEQGHDLDDNIRFSIDHAFKQVKEQQGKYIKYNKLGIEHYSNGRFSAAYDAFKQAKDISPANIGVTLNLLQSIIKRLEGESIGDVSLQHECREHYRYINNMPLRNVHQHKFDNMKDDAEKVMTK